MVGVREVGGHVLTNLVCRTESVLHFKRLTSQSEGNGFPSRASRRYLLCSESDLLSRFLARLATKLVSDWQRGEEYTLHIVVDLPDRGPPQAGARPARFVEEKDAAGILSGGVAQERGCNGPFSSGSDSHGKTRESSTRCPFRPCLVERSSQPIPRLEYRAAR